MIEENKRQAAELDALKAKLQALREIGMQINQYGIPQWI